MKVLIAGMTPVQSGVGELQYWNITKGLQMVFKTLGYEADIPASLDPKTDFSEYDVLIAGVTAPMSLGAFHRITGVCTALRYFREHDRPTVLFLDDWDTKKLYRSVKTAARNPETSVKPAARRRLYHHADFFWEHFDEIHEVMRWLAFDEWPTTLAAFFNWGDHQLFTDTLAPLRQGMFWPLDMGATMPAITPAAPAERKKQWVLAALTHQDDWLNQVGVTTSRWPLLRYGMRGQGMPRISGSDLMKVYSWSWGILCPPYYHSGAGWQRPRIVDAANAGAILVADPKEMAPMPHANMVSPYIAPYPTADGMVAWVEGITGEDLEILAATQRMALKASMDSYQTVVAKVAAKLEALVTTKSSGWGATLDH